MTNLHTPERIEGESFADYKLRRIASHNALYRVTHPVNYGGPRDFKLHTASIAKRNRRARIRSIGGVRQLKKWERQARALVEEAMTF